MDKEICKIDEQNKNLIRSLILVQLLRVFLFFVVRIKLGF